MTWLRSARNSVRRVGIPLCGLLLLGMNSCGGGDGGPTTPPVTAQMQVLYSFGGSSTDAMGPAGSGTLLQASDGNFYGVTCHGGIGGGLLTTTGKPYSNSYTGNGTVFKVTPTGEETVLHLFAGGADSFCPQVLIQGSDGNFYGTTSGDFGTSGTVFQLTPEGVETILLSAGGPTGLVQGSDGNFYVLSDAAGGGGATVFKLTPEGVATVLSSFSGINPSGQILQGSDGSLYGTDPFGGSFACGDVFKVTPEGVETTLHTFTVSDGCEPNGGLIQGSDGNIYGTTVGGGPPADLNPPPETAGTAFMITPEGVLTTLYTFSSSSCETGGACSPSAGLTQASDGNFYGTGAGGTNLGGTAFQITPAGVLSVLWSFANSSGPTTAGDAPSTNLVQGSDGNLYGATFEGGAYNRGYFFKLVLK